MVKAIRNKIKKEKEAQAAARNATPAVQTQTEKLAAAREVCTRVILHVDHTS